MLRQLQRTLIGFILMARQLDKATDGIRRHDPPMSPVVLESRIVERLPKRAALWWGMGINVDQQDRIGHRANRAGSGSAVGQPGAAGQAGGSAQTERALAPTQEAALAFIDACCRDMAPIAALSGAAGTGKSVVLASAAAMRERLGDRVIRISNFVAGPLSLHRVIAHALGVADAGELSVDELEPVLRRALDAIGRHEPPILAIDDAQSLLPETLRYLCLLAGLRDGGRPLFRILLVGRPGFTMRQPIPVQTTLEALAPDDARQMAERMLTARGIPANDEAVREIVQHAKGSLRKIDDLVTACAQELQRAGRKRLTLDMVQVAAGARAQPRKARAVALRPWMLAPALIAVLVAGYGIVRHESAADGLAGQAKSPPVPDTAASPAAPDQFAAAQPPVAVREPPASPPVTVPPPVDAGATPLPDRQAQAAPDHGAPPAASSGASGPTVITETLPPPPSQPAGGQAVAQLPIPPPPAGQFFTSKAPARSAVPPQPPASQAPVFRPPVVRSPSPSGLASTSPPIDLSRYRLYNVGACHHGVCPRWAVLDLNRRSRSFAAFNPGGLGMPPATVQRLREGSLDLIVDGRINAGSYGPSMDAVRLVSVEPHHGRIQPSALQTSTRDQVSQDQGAQDQGALDQGNGRRIPQDQVGSQLPAQETQSPPPGYLQAPLGYPQQTPQGAIRLAP